MSKIRTLLLALLICLTTLPAVAQKAAAPTGTTPNTLTGTIVEQTTAEPVGYATVFLARDSTGIDPVVAVAAAGNGRFTIKAPEAGSWFLHVTMVGYTPCVQAVEVPAAGKALGNIALRQGVAVGEVVVAVQKPLVMADAEKTTYSVEDDPQATTSTLDEIIRKVPQLSLDGEGNVLLNGQSDYKILVNGRNSASMSNNFKEVIQSMPASQISRIEVITNPSTKYEAEGTGGIINLVTQRKGDLHGFNGSVGAGVTVIENSRYSGDVNLSLQAGKFAANLRGSYGYYEQYRTPSTARSWQEHYNSQNRFTESSATQNYRGHYGNTSLEMSYQPDTLNLITLSGWLWTGRSRNRSWDTTSILDPERNPLMMYENADNNRFDYVGGSAALNYEHTFGKEGHTLTLSDEVEIDPDEEVGTNSYTGDYAYTTRMEEKNKLFVNTVQIDYVDPLTEHHNIEAGLKHIYRGSTTDSDIAQGGTSSTDEYDESTATKMDYTQHILGIYAGYGIKYDRWSGRVGGRLERTWNDADVVTTETTTGGTPQLNETKIRNRQFNLIPYINLTYIPKESHNLSLSYTQRLQRPNIWMLSPMVNDTDPINVYSGNPELEAAVSHTINLQYNHYATKWSVTAGLFSMLSNNSMSRYTYSDAQGITHTTYSNEVRMRNHGLNGSLSWRPSAKVNLSMSLRGSYMQSDYEAMDIHTDRFTFNQNLNLDFAIWKEARFMVGENYSTGYASLGNRSGSFYYYYMGVKQQLLKKKLDISITCNNPFEKYRTNKRTVDNPTYGGWSEWRYPSRSLNLRMSYRFGKQGVGVKRTARSIENDDMSGGSRGAEGGGGE